MKSPTTSTFLNTDNIGFDRAKSGVIGFRTDKVEEVNGYECKVFYASPIEVVTTSRTEHLSVEDKAKHKEATNSAASRLTGPFFNNFFSSYVIEEEENGVDENKIDNRDVRSLRNPHKITPQEYFAPSSNELKSNTSNKRDIGLPREITSRVQKFKATLWLCESFPLSLPEQIVPVIDLMAISSGHFAKYRDFVNLHLPSGFPVRIEIPLLRVLNAKVTFGNIFSLETPVRNVTPIRDGIESACVIEDEIFLPPPGYRVSGEFFVKKINVVFV